METRIVGDRNAAATGTFTNSVITFILTKDEGNATIKDAVVDSLHQS